MENKILKYNLQFFADDNNSDEELDSNENVEKQTTYSIEEVQKLVQSETDKRVQQALKTQQKKYEK